MVDNKIIPEGMYCYEITGSRKDKDVGTVLITKRCPYLHDDFCELEGIEVMDQVKECRINYPDDDY